MVGPEKNPTFKVGLEFKKVEKRWVNMCVHAKPYTCRPFMSQYINYLNTTQLCMCYHIICLSLGSAVGGLM